MNWIFIKGFLFATFVVLAMVGTSVLLKLAFNNSDHDSSTDFDRPLFVSYFGTILYCVFLSRVLCQWIKAKWKQSPMEHTDMIKTEFKIAWILFPIFFTTSSTFFYCLSKTSVSSTKVLGNSSAAPAIVFSLLILKSKFSLIKLSAVILWIGGVCMIAFSDSKDKGKTGEDPILGDILGVISAIFLGLYSTLVSKLVPIEIENQISFDTILGFIGLLVTITFWPLLILFHFTGIETFKLPGTEAFLIILANGIFGQLLWDYWYGRASILLGPLVMNTFIITSVPISLVIDNVWDGVSFHAFYYIGTVLVVIGFFIIIFRDYFETKTRNESIEHQRMCSLRLNENSSVISSDCPQTPKPQNPYTNGEVEN